MGTKQRVDPFAQAERLPVALEIDMRDLAQSMDARVRPSRAVGGRALSRHGEQGALERLLDRKPVRLPLPADERRAVIFENKLEARHSAFDRRNRGAARARAGTAF